LASSEITMASPFDLSVKKNLPLFASLFAT